jgi:hypothetical protein
MPGRVLGIVRSGQSSSSGKGAGWPRNTAIPMMRNSAGDFC